MTAPETEVEKLVSARFEAKHINAAIKHYRKALDEFQIEEWESSIAKTGKFVEAVLKALWVFVGDTVPAGKEFKAGAVIDGLAKKPKSHGDDIRLTIPRACRLVYDVASNRGGRHDPGEVDPNRMGATLSVNVSSWVLAELLRFAQKGAIDLESVAEMVATLNERKLPFTETIGGRHYFSFPGLSARETELLALWKVHPGRIHKTELAAIAQRHGHSSNNAAVGISRLSAVVDDDGGGNLRLLNRGIEEAEDLIAQKRHLKIHKRAA